MTGPIPRVRERVAAVDRRWRGAPLRTRLTAAAAFSATLVIVAVVAVAYVAVHHELLSNLDSQLRSQANDARVQITQADNGALVLHIPPKTASQVQGYVQAVDSSGTVDPEPDARSAPLRVTARDIQIAAHGGQSIRTESDGDTQLRVITMSSGRFPGVALQVALPMTAVDSELHKLTLAFLLLVLLGLGLSTTGTWVVVRRTMRPVASLTNTAEQIAETRDLTTRIEDYGDDELGRLASTFNTMLDALEKSVGQQRQLILDASHELRTPISSLRTNVEVLNDVERLTPVQRRSLLDGIVTQLDELTVLVADVVELARGDAPESSLEDVSLDELVAHAVDRARRHWPNLVFMLEAEPVMVRGVPARLDRAVANLLDNAGKFSPPGAVIDVALTPGGVLSVADHGPGVPDDALEHVFDRFYRADEARALPGSGLGLAIVKQVIDGHGGTVELSNRPSGGALVRVSLQPLPDSDVIAPVYDARPAVAPVG